MPRVKLSQFDACMCNFNLNSSHTTQCSPRSVLACKVSYTRYGLPERLLTQDNQDALDVPELSVCDDIDLSFDITQLFALSLVTDLGRYLNEGTIFCEILRFQDYHKTNGLFAVNGIQFQPRQM